MKVLAAIVLALLVCILTGGVSTLIYLDDGWAGVIAFNCGFWGSSVFVGALLWACWTLAN